MDLTPFQKLVKQRCGLIFEGLGEKPLVDGLLQRIIATGSANAQTYYAKLYGDDHEFHELVCLLTINETYFYREPEQLQFLADRLIPRILARRQDAAAVRILSAGCSTGEEPYSIAIMLREKYGENAALLFQLTGGDIDKGALDKARLARYTEFSFRSLAPELRDRYFEHPGKWVWRVREDLRRQVHFHHLNLLDDNHRQALQAYDIIFFRNVSIYFDAPTRRLILQHLAKLLKDDGSLITGSAETLANDLGVFKPTEEDGLYYFTKQPAAPREPHLGLLSAPVRRISETDGLSAPDEFRRPFSAPPAVPLPPADIDEAVRLTREKRHDNALATISRLLEQQPDATDALLLKAYILLHRKEYAAAEITAQSVLKNQAWSIDALMVLGLAAKWRNQTEGAAKWFKQAAYAHSECWPAHYYLAELYRVGEEWEKARRSYRIALNLLADLSTARDCLSIIPLDLPAAEVRFLCEHQLAKLDGTRAVTAQ